MHFRTTLAVLVASCPIAFAIPAKNAAPDHGSMRLVKTSEADTGQWVNEKDFWEKLTSKGTRFVDITGIEDPEVLAILSGSSEERDSVAKAAVQYPSDMRHVAEANEFIAESSHDAPKTWMKTMTDFYTRHYQSQTGTQASKWLFDEVKRVGAVNKAITVRQFQHRFNMPSVIAQMPGEISNLVIVGAHQDSTGGSSSARSPGADDNASGSVTILEAFRVLANGNFKPKNTLEFHWYAGEEGGLLGSKDVYANYKSSGKQVAAFLNQDMTGYSPSGRPAVFTDNVDASLTSYVRKIVAQYTGLEPLTSSCGYGCSDHASARSNGFPAAFVGEDEFDKSNPYTHSARDTMDQIMWSSVEQHIQLTIGFLVEASYL